MQPVKVSFKQWEEEEIITESEVTLVKFDSELLDADHQPTLHHILQKYSIEQRINFIVNRDKGEIIDITNGKVIEKFGKNNIIRSPDSQNASENSIKEYPQSKQKHTNNSFSPAKVENHLDQNELPVNSWDDYWEQSNKLHQKLLMSICQKNNKILSELFNKKINLLPINVNYKSFDNWTPIHYAAMHGNNFALELLLSTPEICVNSLTNFKLSALHVATKNNKLDSLRILIKNKIELNYQDEDGNTALHYAVDLGHRDIVNLLVLQEKINLTLRNNVGATPRDMCTSQDISNLFPKAENCQNGGFFSNLRNNRHVEKLLMKVNQNHFKNNVGQESEKESPVNKKDQRNSSETNKPDGKKENIARMYQLLKEKKVTEKVGLESFKFYKKIGEGAFGEVYVVKKGKSEKLYALKAISKNKILGTNLMRYIKTEKEVLSLINHPFIVGLHFSFQTEGYLFLVMDYCEGGDLGKLLEKNKKFDEKTCKHYAAEILLAMEALHREMIIYRDLKPDNIVLDKDGHALLTDFGLSKKTPNINDINKSFCGTPAYLPLEIINKKGHNRMADWYEYGVVLYELYTGIPPFYADTRAELYQNVRAGIIRFPRGTPESFRDIIKKLLSQNPEKRLGFNGDAEEIKNHPWFSNINWDDVYNRKLEMPKIGNKLVFGEPIKTKFIESKTEKDQVQGWSFIKA